MEITLFRFDISQTRAYGGPPDLDWRDPGQVAVLCWFCFDLFVLLLITGPGSALLLSVVCCLLPPLARAATNNRSSMVGGNDNRDLATDSSLRKSVSDQLPPKSDAFHFLALVSYDSRTRFLRR